MTALPMPTESIATVDHLLGRATMLTADQFDNVAQAIQEAMGISLLMAATHPTPASVDVEGLDRLDALRPDVKRTQEPSQTASAAWVLTA